MSDAMGGSEARLAALLLAAQRDAKSSVDATAFADLDREGAYRVQAQIMGELGDAAGLYKVAVAADGTPNIAPIFASRTGLSGALRLPRATVTGLEVEIAVVMGRDLTPEEARGGDEAVLAAINHFVVGIEICGTRFIDRKAASPNVGLADGMAAFGYCINPPSWARGPDIDGLDVVVSRDGSEIYAAPARNGFGGVLVALSAYARAPRPDMPVSAGTIFTTGTLCGLVPIDGPGRFEARLGDAMVAFDIV